MRKVWKMNFETIMSFIGVVVVPLLGFIHKESATTKKDLAEFKTEVATKYANKDEYIRLEGKIDNLYQLIIERLPKRK